MSALAWRVTLAAAALMAVAGGLRAASGLFVSPLNSRSGLGLATLSMLLALAQVAQGLAQPAIGRIADRVGAARLVAFGVPVLALATALPAWTQTPTAVAVSLLLAAAAGSAVGANGMLVAEVTRRVDPRHVGMAVAMVASGGSVGQLAIGPLAQATIDRFGWQIALLATAGMTLAAWPLAAALRRPRQAQAPIDATPLSDVLRQSEFWRVAASFAVCGFHIGFLTVHMPGVIERCGLGASLAGPWLALAGAANIAGSLLVGRAMSRHDGAQLLAAVYGARALGIAALLALPATPAVMLGFAVAMGATHMATLPLTAQLLSNRFGVARLASLLGVVMLVHQGGGFAGVWLGGWMADATGSDRALWLVDIGLALTAAAIVWTLRGGASKLTSPDPAR